MTGNEDKAADLNKFANLLNEAKKSGDISQAISGAVEGNKELEALVDPASQVIKKVQDGEKFDAAKLATDQASKMIGGEEGDKLKKNMGGLIKFTDAIEKKDAGKALSTASESVVDQDVAK